MILVTGFGPFGQVRDNPSGALASAVHGSRLLGHTLVGLELPVSYARGPALALAAARAADCEAVIALGVATTRQQVEVERYAHNRVCDTPDIDGVIPDAVEPGGPDRLVASLDAGALAAALGAGVSEDAGGYVCNALFYRLLRALPGVPVSFVHVPERGLPALEFLQGLRRWAVSI